MGWNVPAARIGGGTGWGICESDTASFGKGMRNLLIIGSPGWMNGTCGLGNPSNLSGPDAWQIDSKLDDGNPARGSITAIHGFDIPYYEGCTSTGWDYDVTTSEYLLNETISTCVLFFNL